MVGTSGRKVSADADWLAVGAVQGEPVSGSGVLDRQESYREISQF
jgi:hypothetical protein